MTTGTRELHELLTSIFTASELLRFIDGHFGSYVTVTLPSAGVSLSQLSFEVIDVMRRLGLLGAAFFVALREERPGRMEEIDRVARSVLGAAVLTVEPRPVEPPQLGAENRAGKTGGPWDFFIAHAAPDKPAARGLHKLLDRHGRAFLDEASIPLGMPWREAIDEALRGARVVCVLVSPHLSSSYFTTSEIYDAVKRFSRDKTRHRVVPIFLHGMPRPDEDVPKELKAFQGVAVPDVGWETIVRSLVATRDGLLSSS